MIKFTDSENVMICKRLEKYGPAFPCAEIVFCWTNFLFKDTCGYFKPKNKIYLNAKDKLAILDGAADDVICHELYHAKQYGEQGAIRYAIRNLFRINEPEAYAEQERVRTIKEG